ncbi:MAG TPA: glycosyltransferase family 1 protein [Solirubrobacteraceae bacterium]|jgi:glycosyltransferase involved in cell wall biosynthesis|nr:glycosyltransferase family 1 protein [Solirubrobacteraceae bacterium]
MRVALDSRPAADRDGVGRYARCLLEALRETAAAGEEVLATNRPSKALRAQRADVFHTPWIDGAMLHSPCPMVVTIHDLNAQKRRSEHLRTGLRQRLRPLAVQRAARVIVPTEAVAADAVDHLGLERRRIAVIPEAADGAIYRRSDEQIAAARGRHGLPSSYLMSVGSLRHPDPSSHIAELAAAPREMPLVLVGPTCPWAHELPGVILTGEVGDDELSALYSGARALIVPCEQAGFGLPAVEALACGTPVAAADGPALREVLGDRATFVAAGDMAALIDAAQRSARPAPAPPPWSWADAAQATWGLYEGAAAEAKAGRTAPPRGRPLRRRAAGGLEAP